MAPKTKAVSNLARSNAARSGWPVLQGTKVKLFALSNVARSNATRSNYTSGKTFISVGGVPVGEGGVAGGPGILAKSVTINDSMNDVPTTVQLTFYKYVPVEGSDLIITLGSQNNLRREFGGTIVSSVHRYVGDKPVLQNMVYDAQLIDYSWGLNRKKVSGNFTNASVATVAAAIMVGAPGYTLNVAPDIGATILDAITYSEQTPADALHQLVKRVGGDWFCDYSKVIQVFFDYTADTPPTILNRAHPSMRDIQWTRDLSQVVTRVYTDCGGSDALEAVAVGDSLIPVGTVAWYDVGGGVVLIGQQRVNYAGVNAGGGGSFVGPGAAPSAAINATVVPGAGVTPGLHDYAVTYVTASGESIPSPRSTVNVGVIAPPTATPALDTTKPLLAGTGPDPGMHDYAITFVASSGETTPGPRLALSSANVTPAPTTGPTATAGAIGAGPDPGTHDYAVVFQTASGYTTPGPTGNQIAVASTPIPAPTVGPTTNPATFGGNVDVGTHWYYMTFATAQGETNTGPTTQGTGVAGSPVANPPTPPGTATASSTNHVTGGWLYYSYAYRTSGGGETLRSPVVEVMATIAPGPPTTYYNVAVTAPASPDPAVTTIVFYRSFGSGSATYQWATSGNVQSTFTDDCTVFGPTAPTGGNTTPVTGAKQTIPLTAIPTGPAGTTARKIYRTPVGGGVQRLLTTIANNSTTTYNDTTSDAAMAGQPGPPGSNTAFVLNAIHLTGIPRGTGADASVVVYRLIYRRSGGAGLRYCGYLPDNSGTTFDDTVPNASLGAAPPAANTAYLQQLPLTLPLGGAMIVNRKLYRTKVNTGGGTLLLLATFDNVQTTYTDVTADSGLGAAAPAVNNAVAAQVQLSSIPLGAAAVTARRLYRTKAGASQLQLLTGLGDNTTTAITDAVADGSLGANAPTSDTSLLAQPAGNVLAGSTSMPVASVASFLPLGGWVIAASQILRYTGITGNSLIGIPATGPGSIGATLTYNSTIVAAPMLTGVPTTGPGTLRYPIVKGDAVDVFVQVDDLPAQAAVRIQLPGSDGIIEDELQDRRLSATEGRARARARLNLLAALDTDGKVGIVTVTYVCRDINTRAGRTISINIGPPINLLGDFLIQRVTASKFYVPNQPPTYQVEASSVKFSYEELLRFIRDAGE